MTADLTAHQIAQATGAPIENIAAHWPWILGALRDQGIADLNTQIAAAATVAVETGTFEPIQERRASRDKQPWLWEIQQRYWPSGYYGRGYIQLSLEPNYADYGRALGLDLLKNPNLALQPGPAAQILARYFRKNGIPELARQEAWSIIRRRVNGPKKLGLDRFNQIVERLQALT